MKTQSLLALIFLVSDYVYWPVGPLITTDRYGMPLPGGYIALVLPPDNGLITYIKLNPKTPKVILKWMVAIAYSTTALSMQIGGSVTAANVAISSMATTATASTQIGTVMTIDVAVGTQTGTATAVLGEP